MHNTLVYEHCVVVIKEKQIYAYVCKNEKKKKKAIQ